MFHIRDGQLISQLCQLVHHGQELPVMGFDAIHIENRMFWMTLAVDPWHSREDDSQNGPGSRNEPQRPDSPGMLPS